ncbi:MAG: anti-sigma factor antagonist [Clostridia bacterium]|nr:anti-sigma factor antagonist [Clostridia bacterium]
MNNTPQILTTAVKGDQIWFSVAGEIDHHSAKIIRQTMDSEMFVKRPGAVYLDLSSVDFMDSSGLGLILGRYKCATGLGFEFYIYEPTDAVSKILKLAGCSKIINIVRKKVKQ